MAMSFDIAKRFRAEVPDVPSFFPGEKHFYTHTATWNMLKEHKPIGVVRPESAQQVSAVVKAARKLGIKHVAVRGGGHSFEGLGLGGKNGALVIDMLGMNSVTSDPSKHEITAGGGTFLGTTALWAYEHGRQMAPMGTCPTVGIGGQVQCGGYGLYTRTHGPLTDCVVSMEVVTADGEIRRVSDSENAELFFALRGSGVGSFGVITSVTLRTYNAATHVADFSVRWKIKGNDVADILKKIQAACVAAPLCFNPMVVIWLGVVEVTGAILANSVTERDAAWDGFISSVPKPYEIRHDAVDYIDTFRDIELSQTSAPWYDAPEEMKREGHEHSRYMKIKAGFVDGLLPDAFWDKLAALAATQPLEGVRVQLLGLNPAWKPSPDTTSIKVRGSTWLMGMSVWLPVKEYGRHGVMVEGDGRRPWLNEAYELFYPHTVGGYIGDDDEEEGLHGRDLHESYYGKHKERLARAKAAYDPTNLFHNHMSIAPAAGDKFKANL
ncbi:hypothetical protein CDD82_7465 [Ophiocordyceps australis]|uniref:FAD-binding PCMH-type domain-containing protein n=1 Tax=Ophiocordyceps australis TaxID=1399860 RepID=A0A2C5XEV7_9HYPO|nr:hypothetical protein CDD82_7465 [Ophiocordyceps australis]